MLTRLKILLGHLWNTLCPWWHKATVHGTVPQAHIGEVDWSRAYLPMGVKMPGQVDPWLTLDRAELHILHLVLKSRLQIEGAREPLEPLTHSSESIRKLARWTQDAGYWMDRNRVE